MRPTTMIAETQNDISSILKNGFAPIMVYILQKYNPTTVRITITNIAKHTIFPSVNFDFFSDIVVLLF